MDGSSREKSRFKTLKVTEKATIQDLVNRNKLMIKTGTGYYQLTHPETVQEYKEIVARSKIDGSFVTGSTLRTILGIPNLGKNKFKLDKEKLLDFDIFIQSTSLNHTVLGGTEFLYEANETKDSLPSFTNNNLSADLSSNKTNSNVSKSTAGVPSKSRPLGWPLEIVFCFDTTGSMGACIEELSRHIKEVISRLHKDIPDIRICGFAHGDYIDRHKYVTTYTDFTRDSDTLCSWMKGVETTYGGDWEECYELVLHQVRTELSWSEGTRRSLVMFGDSVPHSQEDSEAGLDWEEELQALVTQMGVRVYAVQCANSPLATDFWQALADRSGGKHLHLDKFDKVVDFILGICYREQSIADFKDYYCALQERFGLDMDQARQDMLDILHTPDDDIDVASEFGDDSDAVDSDLEEIMKGISVVESFLSENTKTPVVTDEPRKLSTRKRRLPLKFRDGEMLLETTVKAAKRKFDGVETGGEENSKVLAKETVKAAKRKIDDAGTGGEEKEKVVAKEKVRCPKRKLDGKISGEKKSKVAKVAEKVAKSSRGNSEEKQKDVKTAKSKQNGSKKVVSKSVTKCSGKEQLEPNKQSQKSVATPKVSPKSSSNSTKLSKSKKVPGIAKKLTKLPEVATKGANKSAKNAASQKVVTKPRDKSKKLTAPPKVAAKPSSKSKKLTALPKNVAKTPDKSKEVTTATKVAAKTDKISTKLPSKPKKVAAKPTGKTKKSMTAKVTPKTSENAKKLKATPKGKTKSCVQNN